MRYMIQGFGYPRFSGFGQVAPPPAMTRVDVLSAFPFDKHMLGPRHHQQLIALSRQILGRPAGQPVQLIMVGHTDPVGTSAYNQELAHRRASEARRHLLATLERMRPGSSRGVSVTIESRGETQTIPNSPERSRRVEIFRPGAPASARPVTGTPPPPPRPPQVPPPIPDYVGPSIGPATGPPPPACPDNYICAQTRAFLLRRKRETGSLTQADTDAALEIEHKGLIRHRRPPPAVTPQQKHKYLQWVHGLRIDACNRLREFAKTNWMPPPSC